MAVLTSTRRRLLQAKIALALLEELGRRPTDEELQRALRVLIKALTSYSIAPGGFQ